MPRGTTPDDYEYFGNPTTVVPKVRVTVKFGDEPEVTITKLS